MKHETDEAAPATEAVALPVSCPHCGMPFSASGAPDTGLAPIGRRTLAAARTVLDMRSQWVTAHEVAGTLGISRQAATASLRRAVAAGIVRAVRSPNPPHGGVRHLYRVTELLDAYIAPPIRDEGLGY